MEIAVSVFWMLEQLGLEEKFLGKWFRDGPGNFEEYFQSHGEVYQEKMQKGSIFRNIRTCFANLCHVVNSNQKIGRQFAGHGI